MEHVKAPQLVTTEAVVLEEQHELDQEVKDDPEEVADLIEPIMEDVEVVADQELPLIPEIA